MPPARLALPPRHRALTTAASAARAAHPHLDAFASAFAAQRPFAAEKLYASDREAAHLPALGKWFSAGGTQLNSIYLSAFAAHVVPLELTLRDERGDTFHRRERPLGEFLSFVAVQGQQQGQGGASLYLAQHDLASLPGELAADVPTPPLLRAMGRGDVYGSSIWLGLAPTVTPLHRDPNPNILVQLAGRKRVRMVHPEIGREVFEGMRKGARVRGEEMMQGEEKRMCEEWLWGDGAEGVVGSWTGVRERSDCEGLWAEMEIGPGGAVFIPTGWWHGVRGVGEGVVGSVNWWFR